MMNQKESELLPSEDISSSGGGNSSGSLDLISVTVAPFTGGPFLLRISKRDSVEELKKAVAKKLKVLKDRICLLYRESQLSDGTLEDNYVSDGARITLLPRAETGLLAQKPEQSVMQALESLNDSQVNDFLSGKAPLNLTMRLGDHMMLIQLQLSTVNAAAASAASSNSSSGGSSSSNGGSSAPHKRSRSSLDSSNRWSNAGQPTPTPTTTPPPTSSSSYRPKLDTRALAEASKNLTQTLKQLSSEVLTNKQQPNTNTECGDEVPMKRPRMSASSRVSPPSSSSAPSTTGGSNTASSNTTPLPSFSPSASSSGDNKPQSSNSSKSHSKSGSGGGAIIESMHHHGKGVYSGTFSGTLNPALQDKNGQPKRDITTIIHILNDLLCAQYKNYNTSSTASPNSSAGGRKEKCPGGAVPQNAGQRSSGESHRSKMEQLQVTRDKMEHLRRVMEERKAARRARREARAAPYSTSWSLRSEESSVDNAAGAAEDDSPVVGGPPPSAASSTNPPPPPSDSQIYEPETVTA